MFVYDSIKICAHGRKPKRVIKRNMTSIETSVYDMMPFM